MDGMRCLLAGICTATDEDDETRCSSKGKEQVLAGLLSARGMGLAVRACAHLSCQAATFHAVALLFANWRCQVGSGCCLVLEAPGLKPKAAVGIARKVVVRASLLEAFEVGAAANCELFQKLSFFLKHDLNSVGSVLFSTQSIATQFVCPSALK
jgi:hypothetical protein